MPQFAVNVILPNRSTTTLVEARDTSEAVTHAYAALTIFMSRQLTSVESVDVIIANEDGAKLAEISLAMKLFAPKKGNVMALRALS